MYILYPRDPVMAQIGRVYYMPNEVVKVRPDRYITCHKETTRSFLKRSGFVDAKLVDSKEAAKLLGVPVPIVNRWRESGELPCVEFDGQQLFSEGVVLKLKESRNSKGEA